MIFSAFISSSCSSNIWNSYIYRFKKIIINITQDQKIHVWLSPQRKQQHNPGDSNLVYSQNQTKEGQCKANARQWERAKICHRFSSPTKLQVTQCIKTSTNYQENARHRSWQQKLWSVIPFTAWPVMATLEHWAIKQRRQIWGVIVNSNTSGI